MLGGYVGKILFVNLTDSSIEEKSLDDELAKNFLGGYGLGTKILYDMMPPGADPLGEESILGFVTTPSNATKCLFGGRYMIVHKSPVTGGINDANSGGYFGPELKKAGYDAVFVKGIAEKPVYLWINNGKVKIKDASHLWGKDTVETWDAIKEDTKEPKVRVACIGPAGERLSYMSCPINDSHRAAARGGGGAVMGSKKLKAIAVYGKGAVPVANPEKLVEINKEVAAGLKNEVGECVGNYGTSAFTAASNLSGDSPIKNWQGIGVNDIGEEKANNLTSFVMNRYKKKKYACAACPLGCGAEYEVDDGRWPLGETERPEYETANNFGALMLCSDSDVLLKCNHICNRYGLDTISAGATIAWAMDCYNNGVLTKEELDGIDLSWGNGEGIVALLQKIADVEGCGAILTNGSAYAAKKYGKGLEYLVVASGIELPAHDPKFAPGFARTYQYDPAPGRHVKGGLGNSQLAGLEIFGPKYDYSNKGQADKMVTVNDEVNACLGFCTMMSISGKIDAPVKMFEAVSGMPFPDEVKIATGMRIFTIRHAFNLREGIKPSDMTLSDRAVGKTPLTEGPLAGVTVDNDRLARDFYTALGWDFETGRPSLQGLQALGGLDNVIKDLYPEAD